MVNSPLQSNAKSLSKRFAQSVPLQLRMVSMIDVVFLLLIFFLLTANFRSKEGFLPAQLPRRVTRSAPAELEPVEVRLHSLPDGSCQVQIASTPPFTIPADQDFTPLSRALTQVLQAQLRNENDPVKLTPTADTQWDHVVKAYDALWALNLRKIQFMTATSSW